MVYTKINRALEPQDPAVISSKRNTAILAAKKDSPAVQETLYLLAITGMRKSIQDAMIEPLVDSKRILKWWSGIFITKSSVKKRQYVFWECGPTTSKFAQMTWSIDKNSELPNEQNNPNLRSNR